VHKTDFRIVVDHRKIDNFANPPEFFPNSRYNVSLCQIDNRFLLNIEEVY
jgi:hypothetical protein